MSGRRGWEGTIQMPVGIEPVSPNRQAPYISVHVRVYWPYTADETEINQAMATAFLQANNDAIRKFRKDRT